MKRLLRQIPGLKQLLESRTDIMITRATAARQLRLSQELYVTTLLATSRYDDPKVLNRYAGSVFSRNGEDGIIAVIFSRVGSTNRTFVEFGAGDGSENNSAYLLLKGWSGYWFDGDRENVDSVRGKFTQAISEKRLTISREFFTAESAFSIFELISIPEEFDLLSIDIDRNTSWVWRALKAFHPRVWRCGIQRLNPPARRLGNRVQSRGYVGRHSDVWSGDCWP